MMTIPFEPGDPEQRIGITIDGIPYQLRARWNTRDTAWYLDAYEGDGTPIALSVKLVLGIRLGATYTHALFRNGMMFVVDFSGTGIEAGLNDLGGRVHLVHLSPGDMVIAEATS